MCLSRFSSWLLVGFIATVGWVGCTESDPGSAAPAVDAGPTALRRLTAEQYANSVRDVLGDTITVPRRIDPDERSAGLLAVGSTFAGITSSGLEKYESAATLIAAQALDADHRDTTVPCEPASTTAPDDACTQAFIEQTGRQLFRRALTPQELEERVDIAAEAARTLNDFHAGLEFALMSLLVSPDFLFRVEQSRVDPANPAQQRLTSQAVATRLSYLLWNSTPDDALLDLVDADALLEREVLIAEVERMLDSPRAEDGIRALFSDAYDFRQFDVGVVNKDTTLFPSFTQTIAEDSKEQTLLTIVDHLRRGGDYRDLFTTRRTFLNRELGQLYQVPVVTSTGFETHMFADDGPRAGVLSHASLLALHSHPGRSSATLRGKFVREVLLCEDVPTPPADIDFSIVEDIDGERRTARQRLEAHVSNEGCAGCHNRMDPIGLAFENFDAIGAYREQENGVTIDASGDLDGVAYDSAIGMGEALHDHPRLGSCFVRTLYSYAVGREAEASELPLLDYLAEQFALSEFRVNDLVREIALSDGFLTTSGPRQAAEGGVAP